MRFRRRLCAAVLVAVMMLSSMQIPGGTSYAAELDGGGTTVGQDILIPAAEETEEDTGMVEGENRTDEGIATDGESRTDEEDAASGEGGAADDDSQTGDKSPASDGNQPGDGSQAGDDSQTDHENVSQEETDAGQVSGNDAGEPALSVDTEVAEPEEIEVVEAEIEGAYQFGDAPEADGGMSAYSVSTYDDSVEDYVYQQMRKRVNHIDLSAGGFDNINTSNVGSLLGGVLNEHPDLYFVNREYDYGLSDGIITYLEMTYRTGYDDAAFKEKTEAALEFVTDGMRDDVKATVLHDYLIINAEYDYDNYRSGNVPEDSFNAYGALVDGTAVCNGYALAYKYLLSQAGIESYMVTSESMDHAWNMVKLDGKYYHVDTTFDDPAQDMVGKACHDNLFRSDANFGEHKDWTVTSGSSAVDCEATDTKYEKAFWVNSTAPLVFEGNECYYISKGLSLRRASFLNLTAAGMEVTSIEDWKYGATGHWVGAFSGLYMINGRLFYNDENSIYSINVDGTDKRTEFTPEKEGGNRIYYSAYRGGKVVYAMQTRPDQIRDGKQTVLTAEIEGIGEPGTPPEDPPQGQEIYRITYVLDGGLNDSGNPRTYTASSYIILKDAFRDEELFGYIFDGWYKDAEFNEKVTEIVPGSTGDITLYAKWVQRKGIKNREFIFTATDGQTVSTKADGKPKVLVFYRVACGSSENTNKDIRDNIDEFTGVDVYALDVERHTRDEVSAYKNEFGCDEVTYCEYSYETDSAKSFYYGNINNDLYEMPIIAYIDADNYLQYVSSGYMSAYKISEYLRIYCNYPPKEQVTFKITYVLDGGTNNEDNPGTYKFETETIVLKDATKEGCIFGGWYADARFSKRVTEIAKGSDGNITLYAKWSKTGLDAENPEYTFTTLDGQTVSTRADGKPKVLFFFKTDCMNCRQTNLDLSKNMQAFGGADIYAVEAFNESTKDEVAEYKSTYGCDGIIYCYDKDRTNWGCVLDYARNITHVDNGVSVSTPVIVYIDSENRVQHGTAGLRSWTDILTDLQDYCGYSHGGTEGIYKISYALNGGTNHRDNPGTYTAETTPFVLRNPVKKGSFFGGWYRDAGFREKVTWIVKGTEGDITLYAKWNDNVDNPDYTFTTLDDAAVSSRADGKPKVLFFFRTTCSYSRNTNWLLSRYIKVFCGADIYAVEIDGKTKAEVAEFKADVGCDEITYCYDKDGTYEACFWDYARDITHLAGQTVALPVIIFIDSENRVQYATGGERSPDKILADLQEYCGYDYYWINYNLNNGEDNSENPEVYKSDGDTVILKDPVREGYKFKGWYEDLAYTRKVTQIPKGSTGDITLYAKWFKIEKRLDHANLDRTFTALDGKQISSKANGRPKLLVFVSQDDEYYSRGSSTVQEISQSISKFAGVDIYVIDFARNSKADVSKYRDTYGCDGMTFAYDTTDGTRSIVIEYLKAAGQQYWWSTPPVICYIDGHDILQGLSQGELDTETVLDYLDIYCGYTPEEEIPLPPGTSDDQDDTSTYKVEFDMQGHGTAPQTLVDVKAGSTIDSPQEPAAEGYRFGGWYKDPACTDPWDFGTDTVQFDLTLYAKWLGISADGSLAVQEIADLYYNGKAQKPAVSVYDDNTLLKAGRDYTVKYYNNTNANAGGALKGGVFNQNLPYVEITGKGNYKAAVKINFNILRASVGDGFNPATGVTLKVNDQLVKTNKDQKPFGSLKYGRNLKEGTDYELELTTVAVQDGSGSDLSGSGPYKDAKVPADYTGQFMLTVTGTGNYTGSVSRMVYVADKAHLMKNMKITLGKDLKNIPYTGSKSN